MKVLARIDGYLSHIIKLSDLKKSDMISKKYISFRNFNNIRVTAYYKDGLYVLECENSIKNYKANLKEVKEYIKRNIMIQ